MTLPFGLFCAINKVFSRAIGYQLASDRFLSEMQSLLAREIVRELREE